MKWHIVTRFLERVDLNFLFQDIFNEGAVDSIQYPAVEVQIAYDADIRVQEHEVLGKVSRNLAPSSLSGAPVRSAKEDDKFCSVTEELGEIEYLPSVDVYVRILEFCITFQRSETREENCFHAHP